jgi:hypothetical protein
MLGSVFHGEIHHPQKPTRLCFSGGKISALRCHLHFQNTTDAGTLVDASPRSPSRAGGDRVCLWPGCSGGHDGPARGSSPGQPVAWGRGASSEKARRCTATLSSGRWQAGEGQEALAVLSPVVGCGLPHRRGAPARLRSTLMAQTGGKRWRQTSKGSYAGERTGLLRSCTHLRACTGEDGITPSALGYPRTCPGQGDGAV